MQVGSASILKVSECIRLVHTYCGFFKTNFSRKATTILRKTYLVAIPECVHHLLHILLAIYLTAIVSTDEVALRHITLNTFTPGDHQVIHLVLSIGRQP